MNLFEITLRANGFPIKEAKSRLKKIQQIPESEYPDYVEKLRMDIVDYHLRENSFYKGFLNARKISHWEDVPVMTKADLQVPLKKRLSNGFNTKNSYVNKTSGSSGHPFVFAKDFFSHALSWAEFIDRYQWFDIHMEASLQARFYGIPLDFLGYQKERLKDRLSGRYRFPIFDLSEEKMEVFLQTFRRKKFKYINGYTSSIVLFAKFLKKKGIRLKDVCPTLQLCIVTSEMLFEKDKILLENTLGVPIVNEYGASELGLIAFTNKQNEFIVNSETLFVEILDDNNRPVPYETPGRIVITSLYNKAHPLIRYDIGDTGVFALESTLKKPILKQLVGRTNDVARLPNGKIVPGLTFYYVTKSVIEDDGNVKEFVVEQKSLHAFTIVYVATEKLTEKAEKEIERALQKYVGQDLDLSFKRKRILDRSNRGKLKQFISLFR
ncbi:phenylacetate--CoA ligase family protein [Cochleicola gelatinilyticus]|uniref:AMP-binding protein n=1 Tax=Cochleicola gelatinilyticus TaxID=1763537 RepID=A0A167J0Z0_9FLAO|nr:phenylacetate--CoA ligase family protein [Cochleicola gelatinilyticus]OAB80214.1 AMP-binding protein [Cochleicola gelatinilyticus]